MSACAAGVSGSQLLGAARRRLHQHFLIAAISDQLHEGANRLFGRVVGRNAAARRTAAAPPARRASPSQLVSTGALLALGDYLDHGLRRVFGLTVIAVGQLRTSDAVDAVVLHDHIERRGVALAPARRR